MKETDMEEIMEEVVALSVVVPFFNDEGNVVELYLRLNNVLSKFNQGRIQEKGQTQDLSLQEVWEIVFVDNGSTDRTFLLLKELREKDKRIKIVRLIKNFGENAAIMAGFSQSSGKVVVTIAGDMTERPEDIPRLIEMLDKGFDVVSGYRMIDKKPIAGRLADWLIFKMTGIGIEDYGCLLRAYRRSVIGLLKQCRERTQSIPHLICWLGAKTAEVEVEGSSRKKEGLYLSVKRAFLLASNLGIVPLKIACRIGVWMGGIGILVSIFFLVSCLFADYWELNAGIGIILIILSVQLFGGAVLGEYIASIYAQIQGRPYYIIEEVIE